MTRLPTHASIEIGGAVLAIKPSFAAICEIERNTGKGFFKLAHMLQSGDFLLNDMVEIIVCGLKHGGGEVCPDKAVIGDYLVNEGMEKAVASVAEFMRIAIAGSDTGSEK